MPICLYIVAAALLLFRIGDHPPFLYNWENYTAWGMFDFLDRPSADVLLLNQGLMTDSSHSLLTILPAWLGFALGGMGLASMRVPIALIAAGAVPLVWLVGQRMFSNGVGLLAAILLAISPVFLLYGRTATIVGMSLVPAMLTIYLLFRVLQNPSRWGWLVALQALLMFGAFAYAPIRFLWLLSLGLMGIEWLWRREERASFGIVLAVTALVLPTMLFVFQYSPGYDPVTTMADYYNGRGEQIGALTSNPAQYGYYIDLTPEEQANGSKPIGTPLELAVRLVAQNASNYVRLLLDWDTRPALSDYWNARGRLYPMLLVPFFLVGLGYALWLGRRRAGLAYRVLLVLFFGFGLPLLLTSRVHIGRLIFTVPLLMLLVSIGFYGVTTWVVRRVGALVERLSHNPTFALAWKRAAMAVLTFSLVAGVGWLTWLDYSSMPAPGRDIAMVNALQGVVTDARVNGGVALVVKAESAPVLEEINILPYRLNLNGAYRFVDLFKLGNQAVLVSTSSGANGEKRLPLYLGGVLTRLDKPGTMPNYCNNLYYVDPAIEPQFLDAMSHRGLYCTNKLTYKLLPW